MLFSDIYAWAGHPRTVDISKGSMFCHDRYIDEQCASLFARLQDEQYLTGIASKKRLIQRLAHYLGELNAIHPFREGNGRTQRLFIEVLCQRLGYTLCFERITNDEMIRASQLSFQGDEAAMIALIERALEAYPR